MGGLVVRWPRGPRRRRYSVGIVSDAGTHHRSRPHRAPLLARHLALSRAVPGAGVARHRCSLQTDAYWRSRAFPGQTVNFVEPGESAQVHQIAEYLHARLSPLQESSPRFVPVGVHPHRAVRECALRTGCWISQSWSHMQYKPGFLPRRVPFPLRTWHTGHREAIIIAHRRCCVDQQYADIRVSRRPSPS